MTWAHTDIERARAHADRGSRTSSLSFARRMFPGLLAAAASAGVIVGDGWRDGTQWTSFVAVGAAFLARMSTVLPTSVLAIIGVIVHTFWLVLWGVCFTAVARSLRRGKLFFAAIILTGALWLLARSVFPLALGVADLSLMSSAHAALYLLTIAVAFAIGTRLARYV